MGLYYFIWAILSLSNLNDHEEALDHIDFWGNTKNFRKLWPPKNADECLLDIVARMWPLDFEAIGYSTWKNGLSRTSGEYYIRFARYRVHEYISDADSLEELTGLL